MAAGACLVLAGALLLWLFTPPTPSLARWRAPPADVLASRGTRIVLHPRSSIPTTHSHHRRFDAVGGDVHRDARWPAGEAGRGAGASLLATILSSQWLLTTGLAAAAAAVAAFVLPSARCQLLPPSSALFAATGNRPSLNTTQFLEGLDFDPLMGNDDMDLLLHNLERPENVDQQPRLQTGPIPNELEFDRRTRTVVVTRCPPSLTALRLQERFPWTRVRMGERTEPYPNVAFVTFLTTKEALVFLKALKEVRWKGEPVPAYRPVPHVNWMGKGERTVTLSRCPPSITLEDLKEQFPRAEKVVKLPKWHLGPFSGRCCLIFPTAEEAQAVASTPGLEVKGQRVLAEIKAEGKERLRTALLFRCPVTVAEEEVEALFPEAEEIELAPVGRPFGGKCSVLFTTAEEAAAVVSMPGLELKGKAVVARSCEEAEGLAGWSMRSVVFRFTTSLGPFKVSEIQQQFPTADEIHLGAEKRVVYLIFSTEEEAEAVVAAEGLLVQGHAVETSIPGKRKPNWFENYEKENEEEEEEMEEGTEEEEQDVGDINF
eukprot:GGOE01014579.1.p1 GENE.GGOE01014579.1~~GGOE01014579.1.p1  ORF type:complete len:561 (-),score=132.94 GGOE01014579.1:443-2074(-)